jgi:hypothetical protein
MRDRGIQYHPSSLLSVEWLASDGTVRVEEGSVVGALAGMLLVARARSGSLQKVAFRICPAVSAINIGTSLV